MRDIKNESRNETFRGMHFLYGNRTRQLNRIYPIVMYDHDSKKIKKRLSVCVCATRPRRSMHTSEPDLRNDLVTWFFFHGGTSSPSLS